MAEFTNESNAKSSLDDRIGILNRHAVEGSAAGKIFRRATAVLTLVRDDLVDNEDSVQLSDRCFGLCETLKNVVQEKHAENLIESEKIAMEALERNMCGIERTFGISASSRQAKYNIEEIEKHMLDMEQIIGTLRAQGASLSEGPSMGGGDPQDPATTAATESAYKRLIERKFTPPELPSLLSVILSSKGRNGKVNLLPTDHAQMLVDVIDEMLHTPDLPPTTERMCLKLLYRVCGNRALIPAGLVVSVSYDQAGSTRCRGGFADVWKAEYRDRDVAVKVIRTYTNRELGKVLHKFCREVVMWRSLRHPNVLPLVGVMMSENRFAMVSEWMSNGDIDTYIEKNPNVDRLKLLGDAAKGSIYLHSHGLVHGDLKGANILIDDSGNARLADFGLLAIISSSASLLSSGSSSQGGTIRWMGPELIAPERFGLKRSLATKPSDCYAYGMVIYEVISGKTPFHKDTDYTISLKIVNGERPPRGGRFTGRLWEVLQACWAPQPNDRPCIEDILQCLETVSNLSEPPSPGSDGDMESDSDDGDLSDSTSPVEDEISDLVAEGKSTIRSGRRFAPGRVPLDARSQLDPRPDGPGNDNEDESSDDQDKSYYSADSSLPSSPCIPDCPVGTSATESALKLKSAFAPHEPPSMIDGIPRALRSDSRLEAPGDNTETVHCGIRKIPGNITTVPLPQSLPNLTATGETNDLGAHNLTPQPTQVDSNIHRATVKHQEGSSGENQLAQARANGECQPPPPGTCFGRDELIEKVIGLAENLKPVALVGTGGIGKTHIALAVLHHDRIKKRFGNDRGFICCNQFPTSRRHLLSRISEVVGAGVTNPEDLTPLRPSLSAREMILFLDGAEFILDPEGTDAREIYGVVEELSRFTNISLWITSRISAIPPHFERPIVATLSIEPACDIFYGIYMNGGKSEVISDLVKRLDFHPLSIELLATAADHNAWDYDRLAKEWDTTLADTPDALPSDHCGDHRALSLVPDVPETWPRCSQPPRSRRILPAGGRRGQPRLVVSLHP